MERDADFLREKKWDLLDRLKDASRALPESRADKPARDPGAR